MRPILPTTIVFAAIGVKVATAASSSSGYVYDASFLELQEHLSPNPGQVLENLDRYKKLWIEVPKFKSSSGSSGSGSSGSGSSGSGSSYEGQQQQQQQQRLGSCVWSECGIDDTDDAYLGDNRDGDENWYQYRTQGFCANTAYSLYGIKKEDEDYGSSSSGSMFSFGGGGGSSWGRCSGGHFINSFFTYGGADKLLKAIGEVPVIYYGNGYATNDDDAANNGDDAYANVTLSNANCVEIDYFEQEEEDQQEENEDEDDKNEGAEDEGDDDRRRLSGSGSGDGNDGLSSSLGCSPDGSYKIAAFAGGSCDGNYYLGDVDDFDEYNKQHGSVGCRKIWSEDDMDNDTTDDSSNANAVLLYELLGNSWTCDIRLYPDACPDPHGLKARYASALRAAAHGKDPMRAYRAEELRGPLRAASWAILSAAFATLVAAYAVRNIARIKAKGGGARGCLGCLVEDVVTFVVASWERARAVMGVLVETARQKMNKLKYRGGRGDGGNVKSNGSSRKGMNGASKSKGSSSKVVGRANEEDEEGALRGVGRAKSSAGDSTQVGRAKSVAEDGAQEASPNGVMA